MKLLILLALTLVVLSGCSAKKITKVSDKEQALIQTVNAYPKDNQALLELTRYQLEQYDLNKDAKYLDNLLVNLKKVVETNPNERRMIYRYYRLNLLKSVANKSFDLHKWNGFYLRHPFLATLDLAPPPYLIHLIEDLPAVDKIEALQSSIRANPNFISAYLDLAEIYYEMKKPELAIYLLSAASKRDKENYKALTWLNFVRLDYVEAKMCERDMSASLALGFEEAKRLTKLNPKDADYQFQLANVMRHLGKFPLSVYSAKKAAALDAENYSFFLESYFWNNNLDKIYDEVEKKGRRNFDSHSLHVLIYAHLVEQNWFEASVLLNEYIDKPDFGFYGVLYGHYSYKILGDSQSANSLIQGALLRANPTQWQQKMLHFIQDKTNESQFLAQALNRCQESEAQFLLGLDSLYKDDKDKFKRHLERVIELDVKAYFEYAAARNMLKRLERGHQL